jgi:hypothetical protein
MRRSTHSGLRCWTHDRIRCELKDFRARATPEEEPGQSLAESASESHTSDGDVEALRW